MPVGMVRAGPTTAVEGEFWHDIALWSPIHTIPYILKKVLNAHNTSPAKVMVPGES